MDSCAPDRNLQRSAPMNEPGLVVVVLSLLLTGCGGLTALSPTAPSSMSTPAASQPSLTSTPAPTHAIGPEVPSGLAPSERVITGTVGPLANYSVPCYVERYACEKYRFSLQREGAVEVTLLWQGGARAMLIQLYRAGAGLVHEDLAPRDGSPTIAFRRVSLPAIEYELRVVNMETDVAHPFTLTLTTWQ
jgi:hypothetical protein